MNYEKDEIVDIKTLSKSLKKYIDKVTKNSLNRIVISRDDKLEAVIIPAEEYERMKAISEIVKGIKNEKKTQSKDII